MPIRSRLTNPEPHVKAYFSVEEIDSDEFDSLYLDIPEDLADLEYGFLAHVCYLRAKIHAYSEDIIQFPVAVSLLCPNLPAEEYHLMNRLLLAELRSIGDGKAFTDYPSPPRLFSRPLFNKGYEKITFKDIRTHHKERYDIWRDFVMGEALYNADDEEDVECLDIKPDDSSDYEHLLLDVITSEANSLTYTKGGRPCFDLPKIMGHEMGAAFLTVARQHSNNLTSSQKTLTWLKDTLSHLPFSDDMFTLSR